MLKYFRAGHGVACCNLSYVEEELRRITIRAWSQAKSVRAHLKKKKNAKAKRAEGVVYAAEHLPSKLGPDFKPQHQTHAKKK
jgi:hypothetical protein